MKIGSPAQKKKHWIQRFFLIIAVIILIFLSLSIGVEKIVWSDLKDKESITYTILTLSRIPRTISILIAGFGMSIAGLVFQQISRNKFVSPTTSGVINGAQLGIAIGLVFFPALPTFWMMVLAFTSAMLVALVFMKLLDAIQFQELIYVPLLGMMIGSLISSITTFLGYQFNFMQTIQGWFFGSFSLVIQGRYEMLYIVIPSLVGCFIYAKAFTIAGMGKDFSTNLGMNYKKIVNLGLVLISLVSASVVIVVGSIPFLGLVIPNMVAAKTGDNLEHNILEVGLVGMIFLLVSDIFCRVIVYPYELPIALVVGVVGCGLFMLQLFRQRRKSYAS